MGNSFYLFESGDLIRKNNSLELATQDGSKLIPIMQIDMICVFGQINVHLSAISLLGDHHIPIIFFTPFARYIGRYQPPIPRAGRFLVQQALYVNQDEQRLKMRQEIILASTKNCLFLIKYYAKKT